MKSYAALPVCLSIAMGLFPGIAHAQTAAKHRDHKGQHKNQQLAQTGSREDEVAGAAARREEEIRALRAQVEALTGSQQALLDKLQELEGRMGPTGAGDIALIKAHVDKSIDADKKAREKFEKRWGPGGKPTITPYGYLRMDYQYDTARLNDRINPFFVQPVNVAGVVANDDEFDINPRLTRFGLDLAGATAPFMHNAKLGGKLEVDFVNGGSESRQVPRIRHAYALADWTEISVMAGQYWDVISPLAPSANPFTLMWNAGNLGDRRPQFRVTFEPDRQKPHRGGQWQLTGAALLTDAVDAQDLDLNGRPDGEESGEPMWQGRVGWTGDKPKDPLSDPFAIGFWGMHARQETTTAFAGKKVFTPGCIGVDVVIPVARRLAVKGEAWNGANLADVRGGINQGVSITGQEVGSHGGWVELTYNPRGRYWGSLGFSEDRPRRNDLAGGNNRVGNRTIYQTNHFRMGGGLELWVDISDWKTTFTNTDTQDSTRLELAVQQNF